MKTLVAGWFSFKDGHGTAGDLFSRDLACDWLDRLGIDYDVALAPPFGDHVDLEQVDPGLYAQVLFVCGPFQQGELEARLLHRFGHCRLIGLNLSLDLPLNQWNPFDFLIERDSSRGANADMVFLSPRNLVPVVGICLVENYPGAMVDRVNATVQRLINTSTVAPVPIDTRLDTSINTLRSPREIESLIARMDVVVTTRLHGMVLALKNGVPVIAIDPIPGGAKIRRQCQTIGWPIIFNADSVADHALRHALDYCLTDAARAEAARCAANAARMVEAMRDLFLQTLKRPDDVNRKLTETDKSWMKPYLAKISPRPEPHPAQPPPGQGFQRKLSALFRRRQK